MSSPTLYILCGYPFAGKSTVTKALIEHNNFTLVGLDEINNDRGIGFDGKPISSEEWAKTYQEAYRQIGELLGQGKNVIYDATNFTKQQRDEPRDIARKHNGLAKVIFIDVPKEVVVKRWQDNRKTNSRFDVRDEDFSQVVDNFQKPTEDEDVLIYDQIIPLEDWIHKHFDIILT